MPLKRKKVQTVAITVADRVAANNPDFTFKNALMPRKVIAMIMLVVRVTTNKVLYDSGDNNLLQDVGGIRTFRDVARA